MYVPLHSARNVCVFGCWDMPHKPFAIPTCMLDTECKIESAMLWSMLPILFPRVWARTAPVRDGRLHQIRDTEWCMLWSLASPKTQQYILTTITLQVWIDFAPSLHTHLSDVEPSTECLLSWCREIYVLLGRLTRTSMQRSICYHFDLGLTTWSVFASIIPR